MKLPTPIRVVIVDDHRMLLESLAPRIDAESDMRVVGVAENGEAALRVIGAEKPDVVLLDVDLPDRCGLDVAAELSQRGPGPQVILLTGYLSDIFIARALRQGLAGYLLKSEPVARLVEGMRAAAQGRQCFSPAVRARLAYNSRDQGFALKNSRTKLAGLTTRQLEVLHHLAEGRSVKEIAGLMNLSEKSVDSHKYRIMNKLQIHDRVELARYAIREGLVRP